MEALPGWDVHWGLWAALAVVLLLVEGARAAGSNVTFANCETLASNKNVYWTLNSGTGVVTYALEDKIPDNSWSAFGFNPPTAQVLNMIPSDVIMTTASTTGGTAIDYYLKDRLACTSGSPADGVCPDTKLGGTNDVTFISAERISGVSRVTYSRPLKTSDAKDDFDLSQVVNQPLWAIFASGPLQGSIPQFHDTSLGYVNSGVQLTLGRTPALNCQPLLPANSSAGATTTGTSLAPAPGQSAAAPAPAAAAANVSVTARALGLAAALLSSSTMLPGYVTSNFTFFLANTSGPLSLSNVTALQLYVTTSRQRAAASNATAATAAAVVKQLVPISPSTAYAVVQVPALQHLVSALWLFTNGSAGRTWYAETGVFTPARAGVL